MTETKTKESELGNIYYSLALSMERLNEFLTNHLENKQKIDIFSNLRDILEILKCLISDVDKNYDTTISKLKEINESQVIDKLRCIEREIKDLKESISEIQKQIYN